MASTFADRLWWARHRLNPPMGATHLARAAGCSQSLISSLERNNAEKSKLSNKFAAVLKVDPNWLAHGLESKAPMGWDEAAARRGRHAMVQHGDRSNVVRLRTEMNTPPAWSEEAGVPLGPISTSDALMKEIVDRYWAFVREAGPEQARNLLTTLAHISDLLSKKTSPEGEVQVKG